MDNNMTAIVSVIMLGLGFINGMIVATLLDKSNTEVNHRQLLEEKRLVAQLRENIIRLQMENDDLAEEKETIIQHLSAIVNQSRNLPPPQGPLERAEAVVSEDRDEGFSNPTSPQANP